MRNLIRWSVLGLFLLLGLLPAQQRTDPLPWPDGTLVHLPAGNFTNSGNAIASGVFSVGQTIPFKCTITAWDITIPKADTGTATIKFTKVADGTGAPGAGDEINTSGVSLSSGTHVRGTVVSDFTSLQINANDVIGASLTAVSGTIHGLSAQIECSIPKQ
jgi:hypothetical protein